MNFSLLKFYARLGGTSWNLSCPSVIGRSYVKNKKISKNLAYATRSRGFVLLATHEACHFSIHFLRLQLVGSLEAAPLQLLSCNHFCIRSTTVASSLCTTRVLHQCKFHTCFAYCLCTLENPICFRQAGRGQKRNKATTRHAIQYVQAACPCASFCVGN